MVCILQDVNGLCQTQKGDPPNKTEAVSDASDSEIVASLISQLVLWHVDPQNFNDIVIYFTLNCSLPKDAAYDPLYYRSVDSGQTWQRIRLDELRSLDKFRNVDRIWPYGFSPFGPVVEYRYFDHGELRGSDGSYQLQKIEAKIEGLRGDAGGKLINVKARDPHDVNYGHFKTIDGGRHFRKVDFDFSSLWISPLDRNLIYAWSEDKGLHRSAEGGRRWKKVNTHEFFTTQIEEELEVEDGKLAKFRGYLTIWQVAFDPQDADTLYVITQKGILKTMNGGQDWQRVNVKLPPGALWSAVLVVNPSDGRKLYLASDYDLRRSDDGGKTWRILPTPELPKLVNPSR
jgi:hypothetical protein